MKNGKRIGVHDRSQRRKIELERIDQDERSWPGDLDESNLGPVGALTVKLGVEGVAGLLE